MGAMASQITSLTIIYSTVYSGAGQRKHQSSASLVFVRRIHWWPMNFPHKWPVTRKMFLFEDVIMMILIMNWYIHCDMDAWSKSTLVKYIYSIIYFTVIKYFDTVMLWPFPNRPLYRCIIANIDSFPNISVYSKHPLFLMMACQSRWTLEPVSI